MKKKFFIKYFFLILFKKNINFSLIHFLNKSEKIDASKYIQINKLQYIIQQNCIDISQYKIGKNNDSVFKIFIFFGRLDEKKIF